MFVNATSIPSAAVVGMMTPQPGSIKLWTLTISVATLLMFTGTLVFGAVSWKKIVAWRQFKNYVFLNTVTALALLNLSYIGCFMQWPCCTRNVHLLNEISMSSLANWTLIMCMVIYTKILKVFSGDLQHKYMKANAFAWGMAFLVSLIATYQRRPLKTVLCITHTISYVIFGFYLSVNYALLKLTTVRMVSKDNSIQIIKIFAYVTSACAMLALVQLKEYFREFRDTFFIVIYVFEVIFIVSFLTMKSHSDLWNEYWKSEAGKKDILRSII